MAGVTPEATTVSLAKDVPLEGQKSVPGTFPETPAGESQQFSVNPLPATNGIGNPVTLAPGEKVPDLSGITANTVNSTVTTDKAGYERDASYPLTAGSGIKEAKPADDLDLPPVTKDTIPESSLPMNTTAQTATIQSVGPTATTTTLAAAVPLESHEPNGVPSMSGVPEVVKESISEAHRDPEAAANPTAVEEKKAVETELQHKIASEAPPPPAKDVPEIVKESIGEAHKNPEAAANSTAVEEKKEVEAELQQKVPPTDEAGKSAPPTTTLTTPPPTQPADSVDVPTVTTGVGSAETSEVSAPRKEDSAAATADKPAAAEKKKKNRGSGFFGKLRERFSHK